MIAAARWSVKNEAARGIIELRILDEDVPLELAENNPGLDPEVYREAVVRAAVRGERVGLTAGAVEREHELRPEPLAERVFREQVLELPGTSSEWPPSSRSASIRSSNAPNRSSWTRAMAASANASARTSTSTGPRQHASASRSFVARSRAVPRRAAATRLRNRSTSAVGLEPEDVARRPPLEDVRPERLPQRVNLVLERRTRRGR